jgi:HlyD family secretion protein/macrolide-specific efflux system membrane fusion protein
MKYAQLVVTFAILGQVLAGCSAEPAASSAERSASHMVQVVRARMEQTVKARGIVKPLPNALVRVGIPMPNVSRRISKLTVVEGDTVKVGDVLAELDHADLTASLRQLQAEAEVVRRQLEALRALEPLNIRQTEAELAEAQARLELARKNIERVGELAKGSAASQQVIDAAAGDLAVAEANHTEAEVNLENVRAKYRTDIATTEAKLALAQASIEAVQVQIDWSVLRSPFDGQVFAVLQRQGELANNQTNTSIVTLLDPQGLQLMLYVDETDFGRVAVGQSLSFRLDAHPDKMFDGTIVRILPQPILQENVVYYLAAVEVDAEQRPLLRSEMTALAYIQAGVREHVLRLPLSAVRSRSDGWFVLQAGPNGVVETPVQIGWKDESGVEIRAGLNEGDTVLLTP